MKISRTVKKILDNYESDCPGTKANLARILMHGRLGGSGKMVILPVDQGFEHGPARSFAPNPAAYDPHYHYQLAIDDSTTWTKPWTALIKLQASDEPMIEFACHEGNHHVVRGILGGARAEEK